MEGRGTGRRRGERVDAVHRDWMRKAFRPGLATVALWSFVASLVVYRTVFPLYSGDWDEGVYVFQAKMLLDGKISLPPSTYGEFFRPWLTGQHGNHIFTEYQFGLPAFLALSRILLGSMRVGLACLAGLTIVAVYGFAFEFLRDRRVALLSALFVALSPMFLVHFALVLTYPLAVLGLTLAGWALLRGVRLGSRRWLVAGGAALGVVVLTRPFDALLFGIPLLALVAYRMRRTLPEWSVVRTLAACIAIGVGPFVVLTFWYNWRATGSPLSFPNMAADPLNTFGFGPRRLVTTDPLISFGVGDAVRALGENLRAVPSWIFGGAATLAFAVVGVFSVRRAERTALLALALVFPAGYFFWWATKLSGVTAANGLGPHYYLPAFIPVIILAAAGFVRVFAGRRFIVVVGVAFVLLATTAWAVPDKVTANRAVTDGFTRVQAVVPKNLDDALVFLHTDGPPYLLAVWPFFQTDPDLHGRVIFAVDRGAEDARLMRQFSSRHAYRLRQELRPGDALLSPTAGLTPIRVISGTSLTVSVTPRAARLSKYVRAYVTDGRSTRYVTLSSTDGGHSRASWIVRPEQGKGPEGAFVAAPNATTLTVGVETASTADFSSPSKWEDRTDVTVEHGGIVAIAPGTGWTLVQFPTASAWLRTDVSSDVDVMLSAPQP
jgi:hypothetical protein